MRDSVVVTKTWRCVVAEWLIRLALWLLNEPNPTVCINERRVYGPDSSWSGGGG